MASYLVKVRVTASNINNVRKVLQQLGTDVPFAVEKIEQSPSRADRFSNSIGDVADARSEMESLRDELQEWKDNLPESLQSGSKADELDDAIRELEDVISKMEEVEGSDVSFPSMMG